MWDMIITQHKIKTYFNLQEEIYLVLVLQMLNFPLNQFLCSAEERIEPYSSKLFLNPTIRGSPYYHPSWKISSILQENNEQDHMS